MPVFIISQCLALCAFLLDLSAFQVKDRRKVLLILALSTFLLSAHFALLEQWSAAAMMVLASVRFVTGFFTTHKNMMWVFLGLTAIAFILTCKQESDLIALAGSLAMTYAAFQPTYHRMRAFSFAGSALWCLNNIICNSPMAVLTEIMFMASMLFSMYRDRKTLQSL